MAMFFLMLTKGRNMIPISIANIHKRSNEHKVHQTGTATVDGLRRVVLSIAHSIGYAYGMVP